MAKKSKPKKGRRSSSEQPVITRVKLPNKRLGEIFARVVDIYGNDRMQVFCEDGKYRVGRIRGKIKKRVWIRRGDLIIVNPWEWETETKDSLGKCEITWRYTNAEESYLERSNLIPQNLKLDNIPL